ncbi:MAG: hypothetical protein ABI960_05895 [Candidatus Eisenbacteria bacterium]
MNASHGSPRRPGPRGPVAVALFAAVLAGLAGCGTSTVSERWRDPSWSGPAIRNMLVVVVRKDAVRRRLWEDAIAQALQKRGMLATPSYRTFPDSVPGEDALQQAMKDLAFEGILLSRRTGTRERTVDVPPSVSTVGRTRWSRFWGTYRTYYQTVYRPGYTETERVVNNEVTIWDARKDGQMVWSATTATTNPEKPKELIAEITKLLVPRMARDGIIP